LDELQAHKNPICAFTNLPDGCLVSAANNEMRIWNNQFTDSQLLIVNDPIVSLVISHGYLVAGLKNGNMQKFSLKEIEQKMLIGNIVNAIGLNFKFGEMTKKETLLHTQGVSSMLALANSIWVSGSWDKTIKFWQVS
jgi:WD40 repeat protein